MAGTNPVAQEASGLPTALQNDAQTPGTSQNGYPTQRTEPQADSARSTMTPEEKRWILYDVGNSAFVLLSTAIIPIYANSLLKQAGESNIVSTWGYAQTAAALVIALLMPLLGSI
ncbi:MAG: hypothetical protein L0K89_02020, partial [Bifidobacterium crudilactis]|nr:hypothetical protein [Bifidobacterium crudilactis]